MGGLRHGEAQQRSPPAPVARSPRSPAPSSRYPTPPSRSPAPSCFPATAGPLPKFVRAFSRSASTSAPNSATAAAAAAAAAIAARRWPVESDGSDSEYESDSDSGDGERRRTRVPVADVADVAATDTCRHHTPPPERQGARGAEQRRGRVEFEQGGKLRSKSAGRFVRRGFSFGARGESARGESARGESARESARERAREAERAQSPIPPSSSAPDEQSAPENAAASRGTASSSHPASAGAGAAAAATALAGVASSRARWGKSKSMGRLLSRKVSIGGGAGAGGSAGGTAVGRHRTLAEASAARAICAVDGDRMNDSPGDAVRRLASEQSPSADGWREGGGPSGAGANDRGNAENVEAGSSEAGRAEADGAERNGGADVRRGRNGGDGASVGGTVGGGDRASGGGGGGDGRNSRISNRRLAANLHPIHVGNRTGSGVRSLIGRSKSASPLKEGDRRSPLGERRSPLGAVGVVGAGGGDGGKALAGKSRSLVSRFESWRKGSPREEGAEGGAEGEVEGGRRDAGGEAATCGSGGEEGEGARGGLLAGGAACASFSGWGAAEEGGVEEGGVEEATRVVVRYWRGGRERGGRERGGRGVEGGAAGEEEEKEGDLGEGRRDEQLGEEREAKGVEVEREGREGESCFSAAGACREEQRQQQQQQQQQWVGREEVAAALRQIRDTTRLGEEACWEVAQTHGLMDALLGLMHAHGETHAQEGEEEEEEEEERRRGEAAGCERVESGADVRGVSEGVGEGGVAGVSERASAGVSEEISELAACVICNLLMHPALLPPAMASGVLPSLTLVLSSPSAPIPTRCLAAASLSRIAATPSTRPFLEAALLGRPPSSSASPLPSPLVSPIPSASLPPDTLLSPTPSGEGEPSGGRGVGGGEGGGSGGGDGESGGAVGRSEGGVSPVGTEWSSSSGGGGEGLSSRTGGGCGGRTITATTSSSSSSSGSGSGSGSGLAHSSIGRSSTAPAGTSCPSLDACSLSPGPSPGAASAIDTTSPSRVDTTVNTGNPTIPRSSSSSSCCRRAGVSVSPKDCYATVIPSLLHLLSLAPPNPLSPPTSSRVDVAKSLLQLCRTRDLRIAAVRAGAVATACHLLQMHPPPELELPLVLLLELAGRVEEGMEQLCLQGGREVLADVIEGGGGGAKAHAVTALFQVAMSGREWCVEEGAGGGPAAAAAAGQWLGLALSVIAEEASNKVVRLKASALLSMLRDGASPDQALRLAATRQRGIT
ncbi:hypothetical protein CLOM_g19607 [Closterium sp. NIES-68]|nr:hypothetical protein CLOM_g19607 [Closterium sp. NIES-68]GJP68875.1 hypothetical protein CLOP_g25522 [Closterium sp. NIES-67]